MKNLSRLVFVVAIVVGFTLTVFAQDADLKRGDRCIDTNEETGLVLGVYQNGKAQVYFDHHAGADIVSTSTLSKAVRCIEPLCVGQRVMTSTDEVGFVLELFTNGKARVQIDFVAGTEIFLIKDLTPEVVLEF